MTTFSDDDGGVCGVRQAGGLVLEGSLLGQIFLGKDHLIVINRQVGWMIRKGVVIGCIDKKD